MAYQLNAEMAANVWKVLVKPGDTVEAGQEVVILESMKMEIPVEVETGGVVARIGVEEGGFVNEGELIVELEG